MCAIASRAFLYPLTVPGERYRTHVRFVHDCGLLCRCNAFGHFVYVPVMSALPCYRSHQLMIQSHSRTVDDNMTRSDYADYQCNDCPFHGDASNVAGHEAGIPGGWLGRNERHTMRRLDIEDRCVRAETTRDCRFGHRWIGNRAYRMAGHADYETCGYCGVRAVAINASDIYVCSGHADMRTDKAL